jgi:hypothetical protein
MIKPQPRRFELLERILLTEYQEITAEIRLRIELQQRNMNVFVVLVTAISGYLITYASDHSLQKLYSNEIVILAVLVPIMANIFIWRHFDHDANIIDKARYVVREIRPALQCLVGGSNSVLGFENYLQGTRRTRVRRFSPFLAFGQESIPMFVLLSLFLAGCWYVRTDVAGYAGHASVTFTVLLAVGSAATPFSLLMAAMVSRDYQTIGTVKLVERSIGT